MNIAPSQRASMFSNERKIQTKLKLKILENPKLLHQNTSPVKCAKKFQTFTHPCTFFLFVMSVSVIPLFIHFLFKYGDNKAKSLNSFLRIENQSLSKFSCKEADLYIFSWAASENFSKCLFIKEMDCCNSLLLEIWP